jgi:hypothetical protein
VCRGKGSFPVLVCACVSPAEHVLCLFICPGVEICRFYTGDVDAKTAMDA